MSRGWKVRDPKSGRLVHLSRVRPPRRLPRALVAQMHAFYVRGQSAAEVGRRFPQTNDRPRSSNSIIGLFRRHGFPRQPICDQYQRQHRANGRFAPGRRHTAREIAALVAAVKPDSQRRKHWLQVPRELRVEWRHWPMARRRKLILALRARLRSPLERPCLPFSPNVTPFDYWTRRAREIVRRVNASLPSRAWRHRLYPTSQGVIWDGQLWYWQAYYPEKGGNYKRGLWDRVGRRPILHRSIYERAHGTKLPPGAIIVCRDGNPNNLAPENLAPLSRAENLQRNHWKQKPGFQNNVTARRWARQGAMGADFLLAEFNAGRRPWPVP